jgi:hypothetical protein
MVFTQICPPIFDYLGHHEGRRALETGVCFVLYLPIIIMLTNEMVMPKMPRIIEYVWRLKGEEVKGGISG